MILKRIVQKARTPIERIGILFVLLSLVIWFSTAIHWNFARETFVYQSRYSWTERAPEPSAHPGGTFWQETIYGWALYDKSCYEKTKPHRPLGLLTPSDLRPCQRQFIPHKERVRYQWHQSFDDYLERLFDKRRGDYFWLNAAAIIFLAVGATMYLGLADKLVSWIKSGSAETQR